MLARPAAPAGLRSGPPLCVRAGRGQGLWEPAGQKVSRGGCTHILVAGLWLGTTLTTVTSGPLARQRAGALSPEPSVSSGPVLERPVQTGEAGGEQATRPVHGTLVPGAGCDRARRTGPGCLPPCPQCRVPACVLRCPPVGDKAPTVGAQPPPLVWL